MRIQDLGYRSYRGVIPGPGRVETPEGDRVELVNELHGRVFVARVLARFHAEELEACGVPNDDPFTLGDAYSTFTISPEGEALDVREVGHVAVERDATAIAYAYARELKETIIYTNDLARLKGGFDLVTRTPNGQLVFSEIKGTAGEGSRSLIGKLATTRHKGRQLSHRWIWQSLLEAGLFSASASLFLRCLAPVLMCDYRRRVVGVSVVTGAVSEVLEEDVLAKAPTLAEALDLSTERAQFAELNAIEEFA